MWVTVRAANYFSINVNRSIKNTLCYIYSVKRVLFVIVISIRERKCLSVMNRYCRDVCSATAIRVKLNRIFIVFPMSIYRITAYMTAFVILPVCSFICTQSIFIENLYSTSRIRIPSKESVSFKIRHVPRHIMIVCRIICNCCLFCVNCTTICIKRKCIALRLP